MDTIPASVLATCVIAALEGHARQFERKLDHNPRASSPSAREGRRRMLGQVLAHTDAVRKLWPTLDGRVEVDAVVGMLLVALASGWSEGWGQLEERLEALGDGRLAGELTRQHPGPARRGKRNCT